MRFVGPHAQNCLYPKLMFTIRRNTTAMPCTSTFAMKYEDCGSLRHFFCANAVYPSFRICGMQHAPTSRCCPLHQVAVRMHVIADFPRLCFIITPLLVPLFTRFASGALAVLPLVVPPNLPTVPTNGIAGLPSLPINLTAHGFTNSNTSLAAGQLFNYRVPHSTIELHVATTNPIDGQLLGGNLLRIHDFISDRISYKGDGPLAPEDDPFVWQPSGPPQRLAAGLTTNRPRLRLTAESFPGEYMTWSVLLITVEGLYSCLPAVGRDFGAQFEIWDWRDQAQLGIGEIEETTMPGKSGGRRERGVALRR